MPAAFLNGTLSYRETIAVMYKARRGDIRLLYTSPETLLRPETLVMLDRCLRYAEAKTCRCSWLLRCFGEQPSARE